MADIMFSERWFVDIKGQIRPMSTKHIIEGLTTGQLKVIYRVSRDRMTWNAICNEPFFDTVISTLIVATANEVTRYGTDKEAAAKPSEQSGFHNLTNIGSSIDEQLKHAEKLQEMNLYLQGLRQLAAEIVAKRKLVIDMSAVKEKLEELHPDDQNEIINAPTFFERLKTNLSWADPKGRQKLIAVFLAVSVAALFTTKYQQKQRERAVEEANAQARAALEKKRLGEYDKAVALVAGVKDLSLLDSKTLLELAQAHIETKRFDSGTMLLNHIISGSKNASEVAQAKSLLGLIALKTNNFEAATGYYQDSIKSSPIYAALYNLAIVSLNKKDPAQAEPLLLKAIEMPDHDKGPVVLALFETAKMLDDQAPKSASEAGGNSSTRLEKIKTLLVQMTDPLDPYRDENLAAQISIAAKLNRTEDFTSLTNQWLNIDFRKATPRHSEIDIDYERISWAHIYQWCAEVYSDPNVGVLKSAFFAGCIARSRSAVEALPYAQYAYDRLKENSVVRGYLGYLVYLTGNFEGAKQILRSGDLLASNIGRATLTEICEKQPDAECNAPIAVVPVIRATANKSKPTNVINKKAKQKRQ